MKAVLAIDQGTTGSTALVVDQSGKLLGRGYREFTQHFPAPGEVEHDPEEIFRVTVDAAREAIQQAGVVPDALGKGGAGETTGSDHLRGIPACFGRADGRPGGVADGRARDGVQALRDPALRHEAG